MSCSIPAVKEYMTPSPLSIGPDQTLERAHEMMRTNQVRHLPVLKGGKLVGIVSQRDLLLIETIHDADPSQVPVEDAMSENVYEVDADTGLDVVAEMLTEYKYGSAVVLERGELVGIFTTNDACRALAELLHGRAA
jgi:acetoin utilization protein AcuB